MNRKLLVCPEAGTYFVALLELCGLSGYCSHCSDRGVKLNVPHEEKEAGVEEHKFK